KSDDFLGEVRCNSDGSGYEVVPCGENSLCIKDGCSFCKPGHRKCEGDEKVLQCNELGTEYAEIQNCNPETTGQVCILGTCIAMCEINLKTSSYMGCEYWGVDLDNAFVPGGERGYYDAQGAQYAIVVSNTSDKYPATVEIFNNEGQVFADSAGNPFPDEKLPPLGLRIFNLPRRDVEGTLISPLAYKVKSSIPITAYQFNPLENVNVFSNDASLLLPSHVLGKYYIVMTREQTFAELRSTLTVIAVMPGETEVHVTVTGSTLPGGDIKPLKAGDTIKRILKQFDVLNIETSEIGADLTGSVVYSNKQVAVFGGSEAANAPNTNHCCPEGICDYYGIWLECKNLNGCLCEWDKKTICKTNTDCLKFNTCCADHLEMQLFPVKTWGKEYIATHAYPRNKEKTVWRIMAAEDNTQLTTYPPQTNTPVLDRTEWVDFESAENFEVIAKKPLLVGMFLAAQDAPAPNVGGIKQPDDAATGDPAFILAVPIEQFRKDYVFLAPNKYAFDAVNVILPVGAKVMLDGVEIKEGDLVFKMIRELMKEMKDKEIKDPLALVPEGKKWWGDYSVIGTGKYAVYRLLIADGTHVVQADEPVGVISYGFDQYVSYGYPAGLDLKDLKLIKEEF
ncbi:MAG: IgGFc-binding protein, partial [Deltaproteobacteria bacterium]|nr:IgGFc-binding protein [Deltaproteobacteria bacterium]